MKNRNSPEPTTPICWQRESTCPSLRIELPNGELHLFPYNHLVSARLTAVSSDTETLILVFSTHEVKVEGHALRELVLGIQDFAIKWLRAVPERYHSATAMSDGMITSINVASAA